MPAWRGEEFSRKKEKPKGESPSVLPQRERSPQSQAKPGVLTGKPEASRKKERNSKKTWAEDTKSGVLDFKRLLRRSLLWVLVPVLVFPIALIIYLFSVGSGGNKRGAIPLVVVLARENRPSELGPLELGELGNPVANILRPESDILPYMREGAQNWLAELSRDVDIKNFLKTSDSSQTLLQCGGASNKLIAFYVNCFIVRRDEEIILVCDSNDVTIPSPCDSENLSNKQLPLKEALKYFAQSIPEGCFGMIGFDVRTLTPSYHLGDIGFPADDFQAGFNSLTVEEQKKLALFLPCGQGGETWAMPKRGISVFGNYFLEGLSDHPDEKDYLSVGEFDEQLRQKVSRWVWQNRNFRQEPVRIANEETWKRVTPEKFSSVFDERSLDKQTTNMLDIGELNARYKDLNTLWRNYEVIARDRIEPDKQLALARLESHLLFLEDMVEFRTATWEQMLTSTDRELKQLTPLKRQYQVSRVEDQKTEDDTLDGVEDLETEILRILTADIDPDSRNDESKKNRAEEKLELLKERWAELQRLACHPRRELGWWMQEQVLALDAEFLRAFDEFTANRFERCGDLLVKAKASIDQAKRYQAKVRECMDFRDDATSLLPHAMAFLLRTQHFIPTTLPDSRHQELLDQVKHLAIIALEVDRIENLLSDPAANQQSPQGLEVEEDPRLRLKAFKAWILSERLKPLLEDGPLNAEKIRYLRIAVRYPFLPNDLREQAYKKLAKYFETEALSLQDVAENVSPALPEANQQSNAVADAFLLQLATSGASKEFQEYWETVLLGDLYGSRFWKIDLERPTKYRELYESVRRVRRILGSVGMHSTAQSDKVSSTCIGKILESYGALNELKYRQMQQERLLAACWGSPAIDLSQFDGEFPFLKYAQKYRDGIDDQRKRILSDWNFEEEKQEDLDSRMQSAAARLKEMSRWLKTEVSGDSKLQVQWIPATQENRPEPFGNIRPAVKIAMNTLPGNASLVSLNQQASEMIKYPTDKNQNFANIDVVVTFRGHQLRSQAMSKDLLYASDFQRQSQSGILASIKKARRSVVILLDCSDSMNGDRVQHAKELATELIEEFQAQVRNGLEIEVSLVVFGICSTEEELKRYSFAPSKIATRNLGYLLAENGSRFCSVAHTGFFAVKADEQTRIDWANYLNAPFVAPAISAPLYDAIDFACSHLPPETSMDVREVVIFGVGINNLVPALSYDSLMLAAKGNDEGKSTKIEKPYYFSYLQQIPEKFRKTKMIYEGPNSQLSDAVSQSVTKNLRVFFYDMGRIGVDASKGLTDSSRKVAQETDSFLDKLQAKGLLRKSPLDADGSLDKAKDKIRADFALPEITVSYEDSSNGQEITVPFSEEFPTSIRPGSISLKVTGNSTKETTGRPLGIVEAYAGQVIRVESDIQGSSLNFKTSKALSEDHLFEANLVSKIDLGKVNRSSRYSMTWQFQRTEQRNSEFALLIDLRKEQAWDPPGYMRWPKFAVGKIVREIPKETAITVADAILFTDLDFEKKHYPTLRFRIEKVRDNSWDSATGSLNFWWSFSDEEELFGTREDIRTRVSSDISSKKFRNCLITRKDGSIQVEREFRIGENAYQWILCPDATRVIREYRNRSGAENRWYEVHTFELPVADIKSEVDLYIVSEEDLSNIAEDSLTEKSPLYWYKGERQPRSSR